METIETTAEQISQITNNAMSPDEKNLSFLKSLVLRLEEEVRLLKTQQLVKELGIDEDLIESVYKFPIVRRTKRGRGHVPLLESEIREIQDKSITATEAARRLGVDYSTYKKYAKLFGVWKTNRDYKRPGRIVDPEVGRYPLSKILEGKFPNYPLFRLKDKLIKSGVKKPECEQCGYKEKRIVDNKIPLLLHFDDGDNKNFKLENLKLLCYNCTFSSGHGFIRKGKKYNIFDDPDRAQGANVPVANIYE